MDGAGIVSFGTSPPAMDRRNAKSSPKIVVSIVIRRFTRIAGGVNSIVPSALRNCDFSVPGSWPMPPIW